MFYKLKLKNMGLCLIQMTKYCGSLFFYLFSPLVLIFGHMVFIYSVVRFRSDVPISMNPKIIYVSII